MDNKSLIVIIIFFFFLSSCNWGKKNSLTKNEKATVQEIRDFIKSNWDKTIRFHPNDSSTFIGLPKPYTVPCIDDKFQEMYYWDTYWTNKGLIIDGNIEQAKNNCDNIGFLIEKYGKMLNGNRTWYLNRSQPPLYCMMVMDVFKAGSDTLWLKKTIPIIEKEYNFWMTERITPTGLNRQFNSATDKQKLETFYYVGSRLGPNFDTTAIKTREEKLKIGSHFISECETWDFNPRFENRCEDFNPLDLNCYLYVYERNLASFHSLFNHADSTKWLSLAHKRKKLINKYLFNPNDSLFYDYDYVNNRHSGIVSAAIFHVLWAKIADDDQALAVVQNLPKLEYKYGISTCAPGERNYVYQWDYPNGWPPLQQIAVEGLQNYGYNTEANRIALKYFRAMIETYNKTNNLWEKYNVTDGSKNAVNEYQMPDMMGWTAGVFNCFAELLSDIEN
jgi:alpha,alpha-trehalase